MTTWMVHRLSRGDPWVLFQPGRYEQTHRTFATLQAACAWLATQDNDGEAGR